MTIHASGTPIKFSEIAAEFGLPSGKNIGAYRVSQTVSGLFNLPLDTGIPQLGAIKFSDFYSKQLNAVVDYTNGNSTPRSTYLNAYLKYNDNNSVTVIGGFTGSRFPATNMTVWIHVNSDIGSDQSASSVSQTYCSLKTGPGWDSSVTLKLDIGPNGRIFGAGGNGGNGGNTNYQSPSGGQSGGNGSSALAITYTPITITNRGSIIAGGGGGGGGGAAYGRGKNKKKWYSATGGGGGGGGGSGYPAGSGGSGGYADGTQDTGGNSNGSGSSGQSGSLTSGGSGGSGGEGHLGETQAIAGAGGNGGSSASGNGGGSGSHGGNQGGSDGGGGNGGSTGYALVYVNDGSGITLSNSGTISGSTAYNIPDGNS